MNRKVDNGNRLWLLCNSEVWYRMAIEGWNKDLDSVTDGASMKLSFKKRFGRMIAAPLLAVIFRLLQPLGIHIVRNHFYEPVPDTRQLGDDIWDKPSELPGIKINQDEQLNHLRNLFPKYVAECNFPNRDTGNPSEFFLNNERFEALDAEVLHCFIRHYKPKQIIEIGSGFSTLISANAVQMNKEKDQADTKLVGIEPYPHPSLLNGSILGLDSIIKKPVQEVPIKLFEQLSENDILFIDSSHVVKIGNDVLYEYLEIIPRLSPGVLVHIHDIFLPAQYPKRWVVGEHLFWTEQYLLQAFLMHNSAYEVVWASSYMAMNFKHDLEETFPSWKGSYKMLREFGIHGNTMDGENVWPVSFWLRKRAEDSA